MRLSEDKITHLSHVVFDALSGSGGFELLVDDAKARREIKTMITRWLSKEEEVEEAVRKKIRSYSRNIQEGSPEWDVLFHKHYQEELSRRGKS